MNYGLKLLSRDWFNRLEGRFESFMRSLRYLVLNAKGIKSSLDCSGGSAGM